MTDKRANNGGTRPGAGRKPSPHTMIRVAVSLTPEQYAWLKDRPEGMGVTLRYFILQAIEEEQIAGHSLPLEHIHDRPWDMIKVLAAQGVALAGMFKVETD